MSEQEIYKIKCDYCSYEHNYNDETQFFQGEMWGLKDNSVMCNKCLENKNE
tara:strand:- start:132 stop:284 length:153 start_codon:yes stop_codon:yes gene_type:complete